MSYQADRQVIHPGSWLYEVLDDCRRVVFCIPLSDRPAIEEWLTNAGVWLMQIPDLEQRFGWLAHLSDALAVRTGVPISCAANLLQSRALASVQAQSKPI